MYFCYHDTLICHVTIKIGNLQKYNEWDALHGSQGAHPGEGGSGLAPPLKRKMLIKNKF